MSPCLYFVSTDVKSGLSATHYIELNKRRKNTDIRCMELFIQTDLMIFNFEISWSFIQGCSFNHVQLKRAVVS